MQANEVQCKSILNRSGISLFSYCLNSYTGCEHGCIYCYARFMCRYRKGGGVWGDFVDAKVNAPEVLKQQIPNAKKGRVFVSSVCDPYQPAEGKYELTRRCLEILAVHDFPVSILTKSQLVTRDIDVFKKFSDIEVGMTIPFYNDGDRKNFEPCASSIQERFASLKQLNKNNIKTYAFFGPVLPCISDGNIRELFSSFSDAKISYLLVDRLNVKCGNWNGILKVVESCYPKLAEQFKAAGRDGADYYPELTKTIKALGLEYKIDINFCF